MTTEVDGAGGSFERFARAETPGLLRLARLLAGADAAEDLVQDCLVRLLRHWRRAGAARDPRAYARRSLVNEYLGSHRRGQVPRAPLEQERAPTVGSAGGVVLDRMVLREALASLPPRQRTAVVLRYYADLSHAEIADQMDLEESSARSLVSRGVAGLRLGFDSDEHPGGGEGDDAR